MKADHAELRTVADVIAAMTRHELTALAETGNPEPAAPLPAATLGTVARTVADYITSRTSASPRQCENTIQRLVVEMIGVDPCQPEAAPIRTLTTRLVELFDIRYEELAREEIAIHCAEQLSALNALGFGAQVRNNEGVYAIHVPLGTIAARPAFMLISHDLIRFGLTEIPDDELDATEWSISVYTLASEGFEVPIEEAFRDGPCFEATCAAALLAAADAGVSFPVSPDATR